MENGEWKRPTDLFNKTNNYPETCMHLCAVKELIAYYNNRMKNIIPILTCLLLLTGCARDKEKRPITIGFSQCVGSDKWRQSMLDGIHRELSFYPNAKLIYKDADNSSEKQIEQIKELTAEGIDILIVSPNEAKPLNTIVEDIYNKGTPVIVIDRKTSSSLYTAYIGADNYEIGKRAGEYTANLLQGKGNIIEVMGLPGSTPAIERARGFYDGVKAHKDIHIIAEVYGNWRIEKVEEALNQVSPELQQKANLVFAHNDMMALGSYEYFKRKGDNNNLMFIGVDGLPNTGLQLVSNKILTATALYPTGGEEAIRTAMAVLNQQPFQKDNVLQTVIIDSTNITLMKLQADKISSQQADIERQQQMIDEQRKIYRNQSTVLFVIAGSLVIALILGGVAFYYLRENKKITRSLEQKNKAITEQQQQIIEMSEKARAAHEAKVKFFTNISHEFRTPLTLILAPLEDILHNGKFSFTIQQHLKLVQKNVIRLLRLVNQLMDFRKIELDKLKLRATENNLNDFITEIMEPFNWLAHKRNIDFRLISREKNIMLWFDANMMDKVIFNLLSNAFKFTADNGYIHITTEKNTAGNTVIIKVEDNGSGMLPDAADHAFELFYQNEITSQHGAGLGLSLSKELINLHKGTIKVNSEKWKGTCFEITLHSGTGHLAKEEMLTGKETEHHAYQDEKIFITELQQTQIQPDISSLATFGNGTTRSVLIVEDNTDLKNFIQGKLQPEYEVFTAENATTALQQAFDNIPDIVICDIVLPGKEDGMAVTNTLKNDMRTSHIPVILLTAKTTIEQQIEGMKNMADAYIVKPFNIDFLLETIKSVMRNRELLREHYTSELSVETKNQAPKKLDRKFINEFTAIIENNIANENFTIDELCSNMGISRVQLYRKVKALLGYNVNDYILNARLQKAKHYLSQGEYSVSEVAYKTGFSSPAYFSTVFKSKCGVTPREFKEK
ncbi:hybrid sensor histidine kinase/response regulator transcription factor [Foetidibacter luteolus]|uniref:hybrid sensor histidine kinase/response regulator transcription factor n=1 Tax=Foetidibacter luteolus TaxID=2608880 RepID=UPI001F392441|nr:substrate-binding domain-containing protein [Foetidibacter luteolus]